MANMRDKVIQRWEDISKEVCSRHPRHCEAWLRHSGRSPHRRSLPSFTLMLALWSCLPVFGMANGVTTIRPQ